MKFVYILVISVLIISCKSTEVDNLSLSNSLLGVIYDNKSNPVQNAKVIFFDNNEDEIAQITTDIDGKFFIPNLEFGNYQVLVTSEFIIDEEITLKHFDIENILIIKVSTFQDLLSKFEKSLYVNNFKASKNLMEDLEKTYSKEIYYNYLKAIYNIKINSYLEAELILLNLLNSKSTYVYLLLGDLYQYYLKNNDKALLYLKKALENEHNEKLEFRIKGINNVI